MKKARGLTLLLLSVAFALVLLAGCQMVDKVSSVSIKDHDPESVIEMSVGNFKFDDYTVDVVYASGTTEQLPLTEEMIAPEDIFKLYKVGEHDIKVCYGDQSYVIKVSVKRSEFGDISFPENCVFTYNGEAHTVELIGDIPSNATVSYPAGNSFVNAGVYEISAVLSCDGYATKVLNTTVTVERAKYDLSGITFDSQELVYDGYGHYIEIRGELPAGVPKPTYTINGRDIKSVTDVGEYTVLARFAHSNMNYESIPDMKATLKITPAVYDLGNVDLLFKDANGNTLTDNKKIYDHASVFAEISDKTLVGSKIIVSYTVKDASGNELKDESGKALTSFEDAGSYTVTMEISLIDGKNYQPIAPITREFVIKKAKYDASQINFDAGRAIYDGMAHKVLVEIPEGHDIKPEDVIYEYRLCGELLEVDSSVGVINAGVYSVTAIFPIKNENYEKIDDKTVTLKIEKQTVNTDTVIIMGDVAREYNGESYEPTLQKLGETVGEEYDFLSYSLVKYYKRNALGEYVPMNDGELPTSAGYYRATVDFAIADSYEENYTLADGAESGSASFDFEIYKKNIDISLVKFDRYTGLIYSGAPQVPKFNYSACADYVTADTPLYYQLDNSGEYNLMTESMPYAIGSYRCVVTLHAIDAENYTLSGKSSTDFVCDYEIASPSYIDITGLIESCQNLPPITFTVGFEEDIISEVKAEIEQILGELLGEDMKYMTLWYSKGSNVVNHITEPGEYSVLLIGTDGYMLFDGASYIKSKYIIHFTVEG